MGKAENKNAGELLDNLPTSEIDRNAVALAELIRTAKDLKFGSIQLIIQDGFIVQIDKTEKIRLK